MYIRFAVLLRRLHPLVVILAILAAQAHPVAGFTVLSADTTDGSSTKTSTKKASKKKKSPAKKKEESGKKKKAKGGEKGQKGESKTTDAKGAGAAKKKVKKSTVAKKSAAAGTESMAGVPSPSKPDPVRELALTLSVLSNDLDRSEERLMRARTSLLPEPIVAVSQKPEAGAERVDAALRRAMEETGNSSAQRELAMEYEKVGRFSDARDVYLRMASADVNNADAHYYLGNLYAKAGQSGRSKEAYQEALAIDPSHPATLRALAGGQSKGGSLLELIPSNSQEGKEGAAPILAEIERRMTAGDYQDALLLSRDGGTRFPDQTAFVVAEGKALQAIGDLEGAKKAFKRAVERDPADATAVLALADVHFAESGYLYAAALYDRIVATHGAGTEVRFKQGLSYFRAREWGKAAAAWEDLLHYARSHSEVSRLLPQAYYILSMEYQRLGQTALGRKSFSNAMAVNPNSTEWLALALREAGHYYAERGLHAEAAAAFQNAVEIDPSDAESFTGLGIAHWEMSQPDKAVSAWETSLAIQPESNPSRGWLLLARGKSDS